MLVEIKDIRVSLLWVTHFKFLKHYVRITCSIETNMSIPLMMKTVIKWAEQ